MQLKRFTIGLIITIVLLNTITLPRVSARMVFSTDEGATNADIFVLDADDSNNNDIQLQFGQTLSKTLKWDNLNSYFTFSDNLNIEGNITLSGKIDWVDISTLASSVATHTGSTTNPHQVTLEQARNQNNQIFGDIDFNQNEALGLVLENLASAPATPVTGQTYLNTTSNKSYVWDGSAWLDITQGGGTGSSATTSASFIIDSDDNDDPQILSFGSALTKTLSFDVTNDWFNLSDQLNIGEDGTLSGIKLTTRASATDSEQNQIEIRNSTGTAVFAVDEDGDVTANSFTSTATQTKYQFLDINGGIYSGITRGTIAGWRSPVIRLDPSLWGRMRYSFPVPDDWVSGTDIIIEVFWTPSDTDTGNVEWDFDYASFASGETVNVPAFTNISYTQASSGNDSELATTGTTFSISAAAISSEEMINIRITRAGVAPSDTLLDNVNIHMLRISYTGKKIL